MELGQGVVMAASARKSRSQTPSPTPKAPSECWVDIYDAPYFGGRLHRVYGPGVFRRTLRAGSVVVGPKAQIVAAPKGAPLALRPKQLVADLARSGLAEKLSHFQVVYAETGKTE